jgi:hypothetical protein
VHAEGALGYFLGIEAVALVDAAVEKKKIQSFGLLAPRQILGGPADT